MTLNQWCEKWNRPIRVHQSGAIYVMCDLVRDGEAYRELFRIADHVVNTVSGPVVWMTPKRVPDDPIGLDEFVDAYVEAALWASIDEDYDPLDENYSATDFAPEALEAIRKDCAAFLSANSDDIGSNFARAGRDLFCTRNRHGVGFWDGGWDEAIGERLSDAAHAFGESEPHVGDDGKLYV